MGVIKVLLLATLLVLVINGNWRQVESKTLNREVPEQKNEVSVPPVREKRAIGIVIGVIGLALSVASTIQTQICTFTDVCGGDEVTLALERLERKLDAIQNDVTSIKEDVEEIWEASKRKWYFDHIDYIVSERKKVIQDLKDNDNSTLALNRRQRFIDEVLGGAGNDEYVEKALFHIPTVATEGGLVTHYFDVQIENGKSPTDAAKLTWVFIRKLFRHQEDGYASVVLAASMKYKNEEKSYNDSMAQVCAWWPKLKDPEYKKICANFVKDPASINRRKVQQDFIFAKRDLSLVPVQLVHTDCSKFKDSNALLYSTGYLYVAQPAAKRILIVDRETLDTVKTIDVPGSECGGNCHPFGISIKAKHKLMAIAAKSKLTGGESKVMFFKIKGNLEEPSGISIEHYHTMRQLFELNGRKPDVRGVAFCGERFAYADYNGAIFNYRMPDELYYGWNDGKPEPDGYDRIDWALRRFYNQYKDHQYYLGCSNSGLDFVVEKTDFGGDEDGVGAVPADTEGASDNVLDIAERVVRNSDWYDIQDRRSRMGCLKGTAMDSKRNLFYSSGGQVFANSISGVYQRTYDGKRRYIREWDNGRVKMYGMAVDDSGYLFSVQKDGSGRKCLHQFHHEIDLEDIEVP